MGRPPTVPRPPAGGPFVAWQRWLARGRKRHVRVPFASVLAELMPVTTAAVRLRRDIDHVLSCVQTIALLHQRQRRRAPGGAIIATLDDYRVARQLLAPCFEATAAPGVPRVREIVAAIDWREGDVSETELTRRLGCSKSATSWRVGRAKALGWLVDANRRPGASARLRRGEPLPWEYAPLPDWRDVEAAWLGMPRAILNLDFLAFAATISTQWPTGVTVAELAAWLQRGRRVVRGRLTEFRRAQLFDHDGATDRYSPAPSVRELLRDAADGEELPGDDPSLAARTTPRNRVSATT